MFKQNEQTWMKYKAGRFLTLYSWMNFIKRRRSHGGNTEIIWRLACGFELELMEKDGSPKNRGPILLLCCNLARVNLTKRDALN